MNGSVRLADPGDSREIVDLFLNEYDRYFGKFSNPELLSQALEEMNRGLEIGNPWAGVFVLDVDGVEGVSAVKQNRPGWSELSSTVISPDKRGEKIGGESSYQLLHQARKDFDNNFYPKEKRYTQTVSFTGKSQKGSFKAGYAPVGYSDGQFFEAHDGEGRISTVYMIDSDNSYTEDGRLFVPEGEVREASLQALENLEEQGVDIERVLDGETERPETVKVEDNSSRAIGQACLTVLPGTGEDSWRYEEVIDWIDEKERDEEIEWINVEVGSETPLSSALVTDTDLDFERYQPDGVLQDGAWHDIIGLQSRPEGSRERYFIEDAYDVVEASGIPHRVLDTEEYSGVEVFRTEIL